MVRIACEYCKSEIACGRVVVKASDYQRMLADLVSNQSAENVVRMGDFSLRVLGRIAVGHSTDVFLAERASRLAERLVLKVLRSQADEPLLRNELAVLAALEASSARGTPHFSTLLPQPAFSGQLQGADYEPLGGLGSKFATVFRQPVGFSHTLSQLRQAFPGGVDPRHAVWIWRRLLELLAWVHQSGWAHGALLPAHILVNAREHATKVVGWSCAGRLGVSLSVLDAGQADFYPACAPPGHVLSVRADLTMLARCVVFAVGGQREDVPAHVPGELAQLLQVQARGEGPASALQVGEELTAVARRCFGPPAFVKLELT